MPTSSPIRIPTYRHHKPSGQAVVTLRSRDHYLGRWKSAESRQAYKQLVAEYLAAKGTSRLSRPGTPLTVQELTAAWWCHLEAEYSGILHNFKRAAQVLRVLYAASDAVEFGPLQLKACREWLVREGLCRSGVNKSVAQIQGAFRWAAAEGLVPGAVWQGLKAVAGLRRGRTVAPDHPPVTPVADAVVDATLPHLTPTVGAMVEVQRLTGMRPGEVCLMTSAAIDTSGSVWLYRPEHHKTAHHGHNRVIALGPKAQAIIRPYLRPDLSAPLFSPAESEQERRAAVHARRVTPENAGNNLGTNRRRRPARTPGGRWDTQAYGRAILYACRRAFPLPAELDRQCGETKAGWWDRLSEDQRAAVRRWWSEHSWAPNQLRHARATEVRKTFGLEGAAATLGHSKLETTAEWYAERSRELAERVALAIG